MIRPFLLMMLTPALIGAAQPSSVDLDRQLVHLLGAKAGSVHQNGAQTQLTFGSEKITVVSSFLELTSPDQTKRDTGQDYACGILIKPVVGTPQAVATVGSDPSTYAECGGLVAIGRLPSDVGHPRFAIIYDAIAMSRERFRYAFVLTREGGRWKVDDKLMNDARFMRIHATIPAIRRALASGCLTQTQPARSCR